MSCIQIAELKIIIHITVSGIFLIDLVTYFLECLHKLPVIQWLQEVSADLKRDGFFGIVKIFVSCGKDESGMTVCSKSCNHIQTAHNRHGYIHKGNIGFDIFNKLDSGLSVISFPCNVINVLFFKKIDQRFSEISSSIITSVFNLYFPLNQIFLSGITMVTVVPFSGELSMVSP